MISAKTLNVHSRSLLSLNKNTYLKKNAIK